MLGDRLLRFARRRYRGRVTLHRRHLVTFQLHARNLQGSHVARPGMSSLHALRCSFLHVHWGQYSMLQVGHQSLGQPRIIQHMSAHNLICLSTQALFDHQKLECCNAWTIYGYQGKSQWHTSWMHAQFAALQGVPYLCTHACTHTLTCAHTHLTAEDKGHIFPSSLLHDVIRQGGHIWVVTPV